MNQNDNEFLSSQSEGNDETTTNEMDVMMGAYLEDNLENTDEFPMGAWLGNMLVQYMNKDDKQCWAVSQDNLQGVVELPSQNDIENIKVTEDNFDETLVILTKMENDLKCHASHVMKELSEMERQSIYDRPNPSKSLINWKAWGSSDNDGFSACVTTALEAISATILAKTILIVSAPILVFKGIQHLTWKDSGWKKHQMNGRSYWEQKHNKDSPYQIRDEKTGKFFKVIGDEVESDVNNLYDIWSRKQNFEEAGIFNNAINHLKSFKQGLINNYQSYLGNSNIKTTKIDCIIQDDGSNDDINDDINDVITKELIANNNKDKQLVIKNITHSLHNLAHEGTKVTSITMGRQIGRTLSHIDTVLLKGKNSNGDPVDCFELLKKNSQNTSLVVMGHLLLWGCDRTIIELVCLVPKFGQYKNTLQEISIGLRSSYQLYKVGQVASNQTGFKNKAGVFSWELGKVVYAYSENQYMLGIERQLLNDNGWGWGTSKIMALHYGYNKLYQGLSYGIESMVGWFSNKHNTIEDELNIINDDYNQNLSSDKCVENVENTIDLDEYIALHQNKSQQNNVDNINSDKADEMFEQLYQPQ